VNASQEQFIAEGGAPSQTDALIAKLHEANGAWVSLHDLVDAVGGFAIHSRAADARRMGCNIENQVIFSPVTKKRHSFYRLLSP